jgi:hypothetical protein
MRIAIAAKAVPQAVRTRAAEAVRYKVPHGRPESLHYVEAKTAIASTSSAGL